jgi:hypothetical protein
LWIANLTRYRKKSRCATSRRPQGEAMQAERKSIVTASSARSIERSRWLESTLVELGKLALSRQLSMTPECLLLMAQDLMDVPWQYLEIAITGWRRGTLRMGRPEQMDRFPTVRQLRVQAKLIELEGTPDFP